MGILGPKNQFPSAAAKKWGQISKDAQDKILANVWCGSCARSRYMILETAEIIQSALILRGKCRDCGKNVGRVVEPENENEGGLMTGGKEVLFTIPRKRPFETVFQFKITLIGAEPAIWRRIQVPGSYTFYDLHVAIQNAMGWTDSHLHAYEMQGKRKVRIESPYAVEDLHKKPYGFTPEIMIAGFFKKEKDSAIYEYDFGDGWRHDVVLEDIQLKKSGMKYPVCLAGQRACPPDDCGGLGGYAGCVEAATSKTISDEDDEALALLTWLDGWNPEKFNPKDVVFENPAKRFRDSFRED